MSETPRDSSAAVSADAFKAALRAWASGVTIVTTQHSAGPYGMTASAFSSVSADPPRILVCINRSTSCFSYVDEAGVFAVNILGDSQQALSNRFAMVPGPERFDGVPFAASPKTGSPWLEGAAASLDCRVVSRHDEGTHAIFIGEVLATRASDDTPLVYWNRGYRRPSEALPADDAS